MEELSKRHKGVNGSSSSTTIAGHHCHGPSGDPLTPPNPSLSSPHSLTLFFIDVQREWYYSSFSNHDIIDPKYLDSELFEGENFDCYQVFQNSELVDFMTKKLPYYLELVRVFYNNLEIHEGVIFFEVHKISIVVDQSLFYSLTKLSSQGVTFEGTLVDDWKPIYSSLDAHKMVCVANVDMSSRLLVGSFTFECHIMHYILYRVLLPCSTDLGQATEEDLILMWALQTGCQIDWAHLIRYCMHNALRANAPLPYPHLVTLFLKHFKVPLTNEPSVKVNCSFAIRAVVVAPFVYKKDLDGQWVRKHDYQTNAPKERTPSPPPRDPSSTLLNDVLNEIWDLRAFVGKRFDSMNSRITRLEDDMGFTRRCFDPPTDP
ncbi:hypothetical protein HKD37_02G005024 [Glycine soja]